MFHHFWVVWGQTNSSKTCRQVHWKNINGGCFAYSRCSTLLKLKSSKFIYGGFPAPNSPVALRFLTYPNWYSWCARSHVQSFKNETLSDLAMCKSTCRFLCTSLRPYKRPHTVAPEHWNFLYGKDFLQLFKMSASRCRKIWAQSAAAPLPKRTQRYMLRLVALNLGSLICMDFIHHIFELGLFSASNFQPEGYFWHL